MSRYEPADFDRIRASLLALGAPWEPAEAHGAFCGRACLSGLNGLAPWLAEIATPPPGDVLAGEHLARLKSVAADTLLKLEAGQMQFRLLLPDSEQSMELRTASLADWCHGFLQGLALAGGADAGPGADALETELSQEILADFGEISRAAADGEATEEALEAFEELVEYVRVSAQLIYEETAALRNTPGAPGRAH